MGCAEPNRALSEVRLNVSALSNDSLTIPLHHNSDPLLTLIDSGVMSLSGLVTET